MFTSTIKSLGRAKLPTYSGKRVMMMPFLLEDANSIPESLAAWRIYISKLCTKGNAPTTGTAYLTIDEALVRAGQTHRRPGLHVDGIAENGKAGGWGGAPGGWGTNGMITVASIAACRVYLGEFEGRPKANGDCAHLATECADKKSFVMEAHQAYWLSSMTVHESVPLTRDNLRQFVRISMPSDAPWYEGYTPNPTGVKPTGEIHPRRVEFMNYRP